MAKEKDIPAADKPADQPPSPPAVATAASQPAAEPPKSFAERLADTRSETAKAKEEARAKAAAAAGRYRVTLGDLTGEYDARDANEAWAMFCDAHKTWPSPKFAQRTIERVG